MDPKVTIIIPFYNCSYVDQAIESALSQTYPNIEIIVVDDGSFLYRNKINPYLKKIKLIRKQNGGTATALNEGLKAAQGEYIAWLSSDDLYLPDRIKQQMAFMQKNNIDASFSNYACIDEKGSITTPWSGPRLTAQHEVPKTLAIYNLINGCTILFKKSIFTKYGYFNPVFRYTQDYEMWMRLITSGLKIYYYDDALTHFRQHDLSGTKKHAIEMAHEINLIEAYYRPKLIELIFTKLSADQ
ncbi:glycosyltransferase [Metabacillus sp. GX 13764]|uniref:glycosyltransferase n=1 Tax=Metabacillus kandeliae TaxID=2900151 RepID=UPI001E3DE115|nr:glycosyltransferase [Metabacillus kandeliae]MCD7036357.1 glycosyltransferase [Metabacillus kandeliae]